MKSRNTFPSATCCIIFALLSYVGPGERQWVIVWWVGFLSVLDWCTTSCSAMKTITINHLPPTKLRTNYQLSNPLASSTCKQQLSPITHSLPPAFPNSFPRQVAGKAPSVRIMRQGQGGLSWDLLLEPSLFCIHWAHSTGERDQQSCYPHATDGFHLEASPILDFALITQSGKLCCSGHRLKFQPIPPRSSATSDAQALAHRLPWRGTRLGAGSQGASQRRAHCCPCQGRQRTKPPINTDFQGSSGGRRWNGISSSLCK